MTADPNDQKVLTKRVPSANSTTVALNYLTTDATRIRDIAASITLKGNKRAPLSLIARRSLALYLALLLSSPLARAKEIKELEALVTPIPAPSNKSTRKTQ